MPTFERMGKFCDDCEYWSPTYQSFLDVYGLCNNVNITHKVMIDREDDFQEKTVHTFRYFGCNMWRPKGGLVITDFEDLDSPEDDED